MRKYLGLLIAGSILALSWFKAFAGVNPISCVQSVTAGTGMTVTGTNPSPIVSLSATDSQAQTYTAPITETSSVTVQGNLETDGYFQTFSRTKAQLGAITPTAVGQLYYCSDCTALRTCISTGTAAGAFSSPVAATTACN